MMKKTKIVATIGPATQNVDIMSKLVLNGLNVLRLNMSHGDYGTHSKTLEVKKSVEKKTKHMLSILVDLSGPKIRIGDFSTETVELVVGQKFVLTTEKCIGTKDRVYINYKNLEKEINVGCIIMLDDGKKKLEVLDIKGTDIITKVIVGGTTKSRRGVNIPNANLKISALTKKDKEDAEWAISQNADFLALSFVRTKKDVLDLRKIIDANKGTQKIIAKIETPEAVTCIDEIIEVSDGIMVARGDLAIEIGPEQVPYVQKMIIGKCNHVGKPVITATQMLESMIHSPVPTRAEVSDIANAIFDGTDAVMLSEETALGEYPLETVSLMSRVALHTESVFDTHKRSEVHINSVVDSVSSSVVHNAEDVNAKAIAVLTTSGQTACVISRHRPTQPIYAFTEKETIARQMLLSYGVYPVFLKTGKSVDEAMKIVKNHIKKDGIATSGEKIVITLGAPFGVPGTTNTMIVQTI